MNLLEPGSKLGQYTLLDRLGEGGMATVYLADDPRHGRKVAIKVMKPDMASAIGPERFLREIGIAARLSHPHILPLYDSGASDGHLYYVMPRIEGASLRARLQTERQLPLDEAIRLAREILSALGHAHQQGLVHRDIKPENVLLSDGIALVADFGLARAVSRRGLDSQAETHAGVSPLTQAGAMLGTPHYMAPEQALGGSEVDGRADVYALGCVLYEMLAGQPPFTASDVLTLLRRHANDPVPPLRSLRPGVPDAVTRAIEKALAKAPADRYPTAARFAEALAAATTGPAYASAPGSAAFQPSERTIAVLPFQNVGGTRDDEYLSDGICEEVIHALGRIEGIRVIARGSSFLFRERRDDVRAIGSQLNVGVVLDGTLRRAGKRLRITAQLINVADGFQVWSERYDREVEDVFALEDDIAGAIAAVLKERLGPVSAPESEPVPAAVEPPRGAAGVAARAPAASFEAYERYLMGLHHWNKRTPRDLERGVEHLGAAVQIDPAFAPAWGAMGLCYVTLDIYGLRNPADVIGLARAAADQALRFDPVQPEALAARACLRSIYDWDPAGAERDFQRAIASDPASSTTHHWYASNLLVPLGRFGDARTELRRALELDPLSPSIISSAGFIRYLEGDHLRAMEYYRRALTLNETFAAASYFLGPALEAAGRIEEAIAALETAAVGMARSPEVLAVLAGVSARHGHRARAEALLGELEARARERYVSPAVTAIVHIALGDHDAAFRDLDRAIDVRAVEVVWLDVRPAFAPLRTDPRFQALLDRRAAGRLGATTP